MMTLKQLVAGLAWLWAWLSTWMVVVVVISGLVPPISGDFIEILVISGIPVIATIAATKMMSYVTAVIKLSAAIYKNVKKESTNGK